jgi:hypothetical protein
MNTEKTSLENDNQPSCLGAVSCRAFYSVAGLGWFRLFGVGLHWKDTSRHRMYFSERNGYKKALKIGSWRISFLPCS